MAKAIDSASLRAKGQAIAGATPGGGLAHKAVAAIEGDLSALGWPSGQSLGTVPDVQNRFGLGRFSCRQVVTIMQGRGLLDVRRGPGGGVFVAEPPLVDVARAFALFLVLSGGERRHLYDVRDIIWQDVLDALRQAGPVASLGPAQGDPLVLLAKASERAGLHFVAVLLEQVLEFCGEPQRPVDFDSAAWANRLIALINAGDRDAVAAMSAEAYLCSEEPISFVTPADAPGSVNRRKAAGVLAAKLLEDILAKSPDGLSLPCTEPDIIGRYGCTMPIAREALRLLEDIGAVDILRGRTGGVHEAVPDKSAMIRLLFPCLANLTLSAQGLMEISATLAGNAPRLAAERMSRGQMPEALVKHVSLNENVSGLDMIAVENLLLDLAGNPVLTILVRAFALKSLFCAPTSGKLSATHEGYLLNLSILEAIKAGQVQEVVRLTTEKNLLFQQAVERFNRANSTSG